MGSLGSLEPLQDKVHIIIVALPFYGHVRPLRSLAKSLAGLGYGITFVAGTGERKKIEAISGAGFVPFKGRADFDPDRLGEHFPGRPTEGMTAVWDIEHIFLDILPDQFDTLQEVLQQAMTAGRKTIVIQDGGFTGSLPSLLDSPKAIRVPTIGIGHFPLMILSEDTAPFGTGLQSQGKEINRQLNAGAIQMFTSAHKRFVELMEPYDCKQSLPSEFPVDRWTEARIGHSLLTAASLDWVMLPDIYMQLCAPRLEPYRSDLPKNVRFCGTLTGSNDKKPHPSWWQEFVLDPNDKRPLIIVTSGSLQGLDVNHLIIPAITACRDLPVRLIVCAVHIPYPEDLELPLNTRWAKWIAFEGVFPYTSLIVSSGGYGGISQAFASGIPMILAGTSEDKAETGLRAEATGAAINLKTQAPSVHQLSDALDKMLHDTTYKQEAMELKKAYAECNAVGSIVKAVEELADQFYGKKDSARQSPTTAGASH
ncbi:UDP-glucosyltransferase A1 [Pseudocercospora fuligena]|uniref:UDP-glucosyltransferase A1 n=1 Tax=Pseudocercospora fuligena TaxID=685502 RepID=A0A8H6RF85_9PEZI|nr:UDP-glucosyltransferase A1 [Pseudocercospora fuligena]